MFISNLIQSSVTSCYWYSKKTIIKYTQKKKKQNRKKTNLDYREIGQIETTDKNKLM
jgi:hypothetical protein